MRQKLTDLAIRKLPHPPAGSVKYWDVLQPGFGVRVTTRAKAYFVMYGQRRQLHTIAPYGQISLSDARKEARRYLDRIPAKTRLETLSEARTAFLEDCEARLRPATITQYRYYLSQLTATKLSDVARRDVDTTCPQAVASCKAFFNWCIREELTDRNPFAMLSAKTVERERVLTPDEIRAVWKVDDPLRPYLRLLLLTGLRRGELNQLQVDEYLTVAETKNGKPHHLPLTPLVSELVPLPYCTKWRTVAVPLSAHQSVRSACDVT